MGAFTVKTYEPQKEKMYLLICAPYDPRSLLRVLFVRMNKILHPRLSKISLWISWSLHEYVGWH